MTRQDFIAQLFNNGEGLNLNQIEYIDKRIIPDMIPDNDIDDLTDTAREVFIDNLHDCLDMIELKHYLKRILPKNEPELTDMQVYHLWYAVGRA